jgi:signal peptide peptidase SppA
MSHHLAHIADRVLNRPLMIMPEKLAIISSVLEGRIGIEAVAPSADVQIPDSSRHVGTYEQDPAKPEGVKKPYRTTADGIAIIPVIGSLVGRGGWLSALSGIQSYENLKFALGAAAADKSVRAIVLDIDSPGGEAVGAFETADAVRAAATQKEVVAVATGLCCSAAYAIASAASLVVTTKSSVIGSIGVVMLHADYSHALHERGVVPTLIHAGKRKVDGTPYKPLTDDVKASLKAEVEKFNSLFVATVAEGRKSLTSEAILAMEAGTYIGADAVKAKLADSVGSLEAVLARLSKQARTTSPGGSSGLQLSIQATAETKPVEVDLDRVSKILAAGHRAGLLQMAETLASQPAKSLSTEAALGVIDFVKCDLAKNKAEPHPSGLVFGPVSGGPLFVSPESPSTTDHGWGDVLADVNRRRLH